MRLPDFLRAPGVSAALDRAGRAAAAPLSAHAYSRDGEEGVRLWSRGACRACERMAASAGGIAACRASREAAGQAALRRGLPVPFVCHLGFACVSIAAPQGAQAVLTFGPYCPAEAPQSLEADVRRGLARLGLEPESEDLGALTCVPLLPPDSVWASAEWAAELLTERWEALAPEETGQEAPGEDAGEGGPGVDRRTRRLRVDTGEADLIAAALAAGDQARARRIVRTALTARLGGRPGPARLLAFIGEALAACEEARLDVSGAFSAYAELAGRPPGRLESSVWSQSAMDVLAIVKRRAAQGPGTDANLAAVHAYLKEELGARPTLAEAARRAGVKPNTLTRQLERRYGFTFSRYLGKLRVEEAKRLLGETALAAPEIARRVGVRDSSNFAKLFRRYAGCGPREYRERLKERS